VKSVVNLKFWSRLGFLMVFGGKLMFWGFLGGCVLWVKRGKKRKQSIVSGGKEGFLGFAFRLRL